MPYFIVIVEEYGYTVDPLSEICQYCNAFKALLMFSSLSLNFLTSIHYLCFPDIVTQKAFAFCMKCIFVG